MFEALSDLKTKVLFFYEENVVKGFWKAASWIAAVGSTAISYGPDVANFLLDKADLISLSIPTMPAQYKIWMLLAGNIIVAIARPFRQKKTMPDA